MIRMKNKGFWSKVMRPMIKSSNYGIKLTIISRIIQYSPTHLITNVTYWLLFLNKDSPYSNPTCITLYFKHVVKIRENKNRCIAKHEFDFIKSPLSIFTPFKFTLFC